MTYSHALRYITEPVGVRSAPDTEALWAELGMGKLSPFGIHVPEDKQGRACAVFLCSVLRKADISVLCVMDNPSLPVRERFLRNGEPLPPPLLCALCQRVRDTELAHLRAGAGDGAPALFSAEQRCALVLALLLASTDAPTPVLLFVGDATGSLCRALSRLVPALSRLALVTAADAISAVRQGTRDVVSLTGGRVFYRHLTDACARTGSRLSMIPAPDPAQCDRRPGGQTIRRDIPLHLSCAAPSLLRAALLAEGGIACLRRQNFVFPEEALSAGLEEARFPLYFSLRSLSPMTLVCSVDNAFDFSLSLEDLRVLSSLLPHPLRVFASEMLFRRLSEEADLYDTLLPLSASVPAGDEGCALFFADSPALRALFPR